jgi:hypothetical protein
MIHPALERAEAPPEDEPKAAPPPEVIRMIQAFEAADLKIKDLKKKRATVKKERAILDKELRKLDRQIASILKCVPVGPARTSLVEFLSFALDGKRK